MSDTSAEIETFKASVERIFGNTPNLAFGPLYTNDSSILQSLRSAGVIHHAFREHPENEAYWNDYANGPYYLAQSLPGQAAFGGYVVLLPITFALLKWEDFRQILDAPTRNRFITEAERHLENVIATYETILHRFPDDPYHELVRAKVNYCNERLEWLSSEKKGNRRAVKMALYSAGSDGATLLNSVWQAATTILVFVKTKSLIVAQIAPPVVTVAANVANAVGATLNPISAFFIWRVARSASVHSAKNANAFREGKEKVDLFMDSLERVEADPHLAEARQLYQRDLQTKLNQRDTFYQKSEKWNSNFLRWSILYGLGAIAKTAIAVAGLAGAVAVAANPVGAGILVGVGIVGAVAVCACYQHHFIAQRKLARYNRTHNDPILDKEFLEHVERGHHNGITKGFELRAQFYSLARHGENRRQDLLEQAAMHEQKFYRRVQYSTDANYSAGARVRITEFCRDLMPRFHACAAMIGTFLLTGKTQKAKEQRREVWSERCPRLTTFRLENWLRKPASFGSQANFMLQGIRDQSDYLEKKIRVRFEIYKEAGLGQQRATAGKRGGLEDNGLQPQDKELLTRLHPDLQKDIRLLERSRQLVDEIEQVKSKIRADSVGGEELRRLSGEFLQLQGDGEKNLAEHLIRPEKFRAQRNLLIWAELNLAERRSEPATRPAESIPETRIVLPVTWKHVSPDLGDVVSFLERPGASAMSQTEFTQPQQFGSIELARNQKIYDSPAKKVFQKLHTGDGDRGEARGNAQGMH
jgi:hypothetical protein